MIIDSQPVVDEAEMSSQCIWNIEEYMRQSCERNCRPTHQLLMQVKRSVDSISSQLMTINCPQSTTTQSNVEEKQHLVSALIGKFAYVRVLHSLTENIRKVRVMFLFILMEQNFHSITLYT